MNEVCDALLSDTHIRSCTAPNLNVSCLREVKVKELDVRLRKLLLCPTFFKVRVCIAVFLMGTASAGGVLWAWALNLVIGSPLH